MVLDLTIGSQLQLLLNIISAERERILMIFIAPPCGTASRARGRPIKSSLLRGGKAPVPLRSDEQPDGLDNLQGTDKLKTELANQLYDAISQLVIFAATMDICVVLENPANSLYWKTSFAQRIFSQISGVMTEFHNCCHGGSRDKLTSFWCNKDWMRPLHLYCDKQHPHQSWRPRIQDGKLIFPTAEEAAYPWLLCTRIINLAIDAAKRLGAVLFTTLQEQLNHADFTLMNRYIFEALPRSTKLRPLVPEFSHYTFVVTPAQHVDHCKDVLQQFPKGSKIFVPQTLDMGDFSGGTIQW